LKLPLALLTWFDSHDWRVVSVEAIVGVYAAKLYRISVIDNVEVTHRLIFKEFAPNRAQEIQIYLTLLNSLPDYVPQLHTLVQRDDKNPAGMLVDDAGPTLKETLRQIDAAPAKKLLLEAVQWLAKLHLAFETQSADWLARGVLQEYPLDSSLAWGTEALSALTWFRDEDCCGVRDAEIDEVCAMVNAFYPRYPAYVKGKTTVTHGDPHHENILYLQQTFSLIDWEFCCVTVPQRDIAIFLQDVLDVPLHQAALATYFNSLRDGGWAVDSYTFQQTFHACFFDNTFMMLGWEIHKFREGHLDATDLNRLVASKLGWLRETYAVLYRTPDEA